MAPALTLADRGPDLRIVDERTRPRRARAVTPTVRVLIAEAEGLVRAGLRTLLQAREQIAVVAEAGSGEQAISLTRDRRPDVALLDARLPGLDAVETTRAMLTDRHVAVLLLTGSEDDELALAALRAGASGALVKDAEPTELIRAVRVLSRGDALLSPSIARRLIAELAAQPLPAEPSLRLLEELTPREREVVGLAALGLSNGEIAERLVVAPATAKTHVSRAMGKLHARHRAQLVAIAYETGLAARREGRTTGLEPATARTTTESSTS